MQLHTVSGFHLITHLHHVQLAMPEGQEEQAVAFYSGVLGLAQVEKPAALAKRGGAWFCRRDVQVHLGVETPFQPAKKAHPAFLCENLDTLAGALENAGYPVLWDDDLIGYRRFYSADPFGNRIEFLQPAV